ncbi:MAG: hypothetical protein J6M53_02315 [Bacteroidaceae bacterium]|nr:hypothetical protein [Bacteroidaceae bacterium]
MKVYVTPSIEVAVVSPQSAMLATSDNFHIGDSSTIPVDPTEPHDPGDALTRRGGWGDGW